jgi:general secretion pathway protein A
MKSDNFGLKSAPFSTIPPKGGLFLGAGHREALAALEWGLDEPTGFTLLTGEVGTGKTTLIDALMTTQREQTRIALIQDPRLSFEEMLVDLLRQFAVPSLVRGRADLTRALAKAGESRRFVIIVDEAQGLSDSLLEDLRLLSNLASGNLKLILVGQPELSSRLAQPTLRQLSQRIGARATLTALDPSEIVDYVACRVIAAGSDVERVFAPRALDAVVKLSGGIPRRINTICYNSIVLASLSDTSAVLPSHVYDAAKELAGPREARAYFKLRSLTRLQTWLPLVLGLAAACVLFAVSILSEGRTGPVARAEGTAPLQPRAVPEKARSAVVPAKNSMFIENHRSLSKSAQTETQDSASLRSAATPNASRNSVVKPSPQAADRYPRAEEVVVEDGDSLSKIAQRRFGSNDQNVMGQLIAANPQIANPNLIYPGENIRLVNR